MDHLILPHAKLLFHIQQLCKRNIITDDEKDKLKECVFLQDPQIFDLLSIWETEQNIDKLTIGIKKICR